MIIIVLSSSSCIKKKKEQNQALRVGRFLNVPTSDVERKSSRSLHAHKYITAQDEEKKKRVTKKKKKIYSRIVCEAATRARSHLIAHPTQFIFIFFFHDYQWYKILTRTLFCFRFFLLFCLRYSQNSIVEKVSGQLVVSIFTLPTYSFVKWLFMCRI